APEGGRLRVLVRDDHQVALADPVRGTLRRVVEVRDDGAGIPAADLPRIFRPFYTTKSSGTGLGLAISHKIVTAHGGEIAVDRDGSETVFRVALPRRAADAAPRQREEAS
ncbi:MAG: ATP-binding protein, partial [Candidatus Krumholzibacteriia bacterium]